MSVWLSSRTNRSPPRRLFLNVPVLAGVMIVTLAGQVGLLSKLPEMAATELAWVVLSIACYSSLFTALAALAGGYAGRTGAGFVSALAWMVLLAASSLYLANCAGYLWLGLHLDETLPMLVENLPSFQTTMRSKMTALIGVIIVFMTAFIGGTLVLWHARGRRAWLERPTTVRRAAAWVCGLALLLGAERTLAPHVLGPAAYDARNRVLWQPLLYAPRHPAAPARIFEIDAPQFRQVIPEAAIADALSKVGPADVQRPKNVFFFIIESLREDAVNEDVAPESVRAQAAVAARGNRCRGIERDTYLMDLDHARGESSVLECRRASGAQSWSPSDARAERVRIPDPRAVVLQPRVTLAWNDPCSETAPPWRRQ